MKKAISILTICTLILLHSISFVCADRGSPAPIIAIIGSGIASQELEGRLWTNPGDVPGNGLDDDNNGYIDDVHGWNFNIWEDNNDLWDFHGTGTRYAEIVANSCSNCRIMPIKINSQDVEWAPALAKAIIYATDNKADVICISTLWRENSEIEEAVGYAEGKGVILVASASYEYLTMRYPAAYNNVIAVTSVNEDNTITYGSYMYAMDNWGFTPYVDFVVPVDSYGKAAPYMAGVIGDTLSKVPFDEIEEYLCENSYDVLDPLGDGNLLAGTDKYTGCGKVKE